jgi:hypothetical protein
MFKRSQTMVLVTLMFENRTARAPVWQTKIVLKWKVAITIETNTV